MKIYLVACGKRKRKYTTVAKDMYTSVLFRLINENIADKVWYILSAKHGLLTPDTVIDPYNLSLGEIQVEDRLLWGERCIEDLLSYHRHDFEVVILAGKMYRKYITPSLERHYISYTIPLDGLGIGKQQKYLKENTL